ncbi:MAG: ComEA family DNA-binding protein [Ruminococcaceae bacterium]|nr:ComEA family DNA-binding protein [Oscillospiraceae bacterium]
MWRQRIEEFLRDGRFMVRVIAGAIVLTVAGIICVLLFSERTEKVEPQLTVLHSDDIGENEIMVDIKGDVVNPGVYTLPDGSRMKDAVEAAGGFLNEQEPSVNLAQKVQDGEMIVIGQNKVNLNTAEIQELKSLFGIGDVLAKRIVDYREENGGFYSIEEIMLIPGIGNGLFEKIKDLITV